MTEGRSRVLEHRLEWPIIVALSENFPLATKGDRWSVTARRRIAMWPTLLIILYCLCLVVASLFGGRLPSLIQLTHIRMQWMMSFVGGLMMGVALLHLLPHAALETNSLDYASWSTMLGLLAMFVTIRVFHVHQHGPAAGGDESQDAEHGSHAEHHDRHAGGQIEDHAHRLSWIGLFLGLAVHTLIDGVAVAASVTAAAKHDVGLGLLGFGTFLAVLLHKPLDSLSITSVMLVGKWSRRACDLINLLFSLICPLGALLFFFGTRELAESQHVAVGCALGFSAGVFLCISLADILPEIQFHRHDRAKLFTAILLGVALSWAIGLCEPGHSPDQWHPSHSAHPGHVE